LNGVAPVCVAGSALALEEAMFQVDPWEKAADCDRALRISLDPVHREILANIREFWIALAQERPFLSEEELAKQAETIGRLHARMASRDAASIH
jgi:hypothetical protein